MEIFAAPEKRTAALGRAVRHGLRLGLSSCWRVYGSALNRVLHGNTQVVGLVIAFAMPPGLAFLMESEGGCDLDAFAHEWGELPRSLEKARACLDAYERARKDFLLASSEFKRARYELTLASSECARARGMIAREAPPMPR